VAGDFRRASECFRILTRPENRRLGPEEGAAYLNLARIATRRGEYARAASLLADAREIATKWRLQGLLADVLEEEGNLHRERGDLKTAGERYARARALLTELGLPDLLDGLAGEEAILAARRGNHGEAETLAAEAVESRRSADDAEGAAHALLALGEVRVRAHAAPRAAKALIEAGAFFSSTGRAYHECEARLWLALARHLERDRHRAVAQAIMALEIAARHDYQATISRIASLDPEFRGLLASLAKAPSSLVGPSLPGVGGTHAACGVRGEGGEADLTVRLLGPIEMSRDARQRVPSRVETMRREIQVLCYLALAPGHRATRDQLADALWLTSRPASLERHFRPTISLLRRVLNHGHNVPRNFIVCEREAYLLNPAYRYDIDVEVFEERVRSARRRSAVQDPAGALADYDSAIALYRGPLMEEEFGDWIEAPRARFESLYADALGEAGDLHLQSGHAEKGVTCFRTLVDRDPLDEGASASLMRALGELGDREAIDREFSRLRQTLADERGAAPQPESRLAYEQALQATSFEAEPAVAPSTRTAPGRREAAVTMKLEGK
jgi:DNA-binding SARP family transcriptional activator